MIQPRDSVRKTTRLADTTDRLNCLRLDRNERVSAFGRDLLETLLSRISAEDLICYPNPEPLYECMADWLGVARNQLLLSHGSDGAIRSVFETYLRPGESVVLAEPTYAMYAVYAGLYGGSTRVCQYDRSLALDVDPFCESIVRGTRLVILANPNSPTGTLLQSRAVLQVIEAAARVDALVVVDEAYYYFCRQTMLDCASTYDNVIVTRTFSKAAGLAGLRVGFAVASPEVIGHLTKVKPTYEISGVAMRVVEYMIDHEEILWNYADETIEGQQWLAARLLEKGLQVHTSPTNFLLARIPRSVDIPELVGRLAAAHVLIRGPFEHPCLDRCIRVTTGPVSQMKTFWSAFEPIYEELLSDSDELVADCSVVTPESVRN